LQLCFKNSHSALVSVAVMWYSPGTCGGEGGDWETRGWWNIAPGHSVGTNVWTSNRYFAFFAEGQDGAVWTGPVGPPGGAEVSIDAFDRCIDIGTSVSDGPSPFFNVGFRLVDAGWWSWSYLTYTVNLT
jgi:hypothetical protein